MYTQIDKKLIAIGNNIRKYRQLKHHNQEKLAELLGVSCSTISRIENGTSAVDILILMELSKTLEQPIENIINITENNFQI